jgi:hypothetical protein
MKPISRISNRAGHTSAAANIASDSETENLTPGIVSVEDSLITMKRFRVQFVRAALSLALVSVVPGVTPAQPRPKPAAQNDLSLARVTIEVTGGEKDAPIENASVYLKYVKDRKVVKDKQYELNVKTNRDGIAHVPNAPLGRVLIQIIAEGWKTYGRWYDITDAKQPIKIHLEKPPKWY